MYILLLWYWVKSSWIATFLRALCSCSCEAWNSCAEILTDCTNVFVTFRSTFSVQKISFAPFCRVVIHSCVRVFRKFLTLPHGRCIFSRTYSTGTYSKFFQAHLLNALFSALHFLYLPSQNEYGISSHVHTLATFSLCSDWLQLCVIAVNSLLNTSWILTGFFIALLAEHSPSFARSFYAELL